MIENYNIIFQTFSEHLQLMLKDLYHEGRYADVTLVSEDKIEFKAHKIVLSAFSPVLKTIIDNQETEEKPSIDVKAIQSGELESILQFMYLGASKVHGIGQFEQFLKAAKNLEVKEIYDGLEIQKMEDEKTGNVQESSDKFTTKCSENDRQTMLEHDKNIQCDFQVSKQSSFNIHVKYPCNQCDHQAKSKAYLHQHMKSSHEGIAYKYPCHKCDYKASVKNHLEEHIQAIHEGIKYPCNQCDYKATRQRSLKIHIQSKHEVIKYQCNQCEYQASTPKNLESHFESRHEGIIYPCKQCDYQATHKGSLQQHIRSQHEGIKYPCNECDYNATAKKHLQEHIAIHEGIKYPCDQCDYQASRQRDVKNHIRTKHGGIRYPCNQCEFRATTQRSLYMHVQSKHECTKYPCMQCDFETPLLYYLKKHIKEKHDDKSQTLKDEMKSSLIANEDEDDEIKRYFNILQ